MSLIATLDVALRGQTGDLDNKLRRAELGVKAYASAVEQAGAKIDTALAVMTGGLSRLVGIGTYFTDSFGRAWDEFKRMISEGASGIAALAKSAEQLGITTQMLGGLEHAAALNGLSFEELSGNLVKFQQHLGQAFNAGGPVVQTLAQLGIQLDDLKDKNLYEQFLLLSDGFKKFGNAMDKTRIARELFGRGGVVMKKILMEGGDGLRAMTEEAMRLGIAVGTDQADAVRRGRRALREYEQAMVGIGRSLAVVVAPLLESTNKAWARVAKTVAEFTQENIPLFDVFVQALISVKTAAIEMAGELASKVGGAIAALFEQFSGGGGFNAFRDMLLRGFYAIQYAAENWKFILSVALDGVELAFLFLKRNVELAMKSIELEVVKGFNELQKQLGMTDNDVVKLANDFANLFELLKRAGKIVYTLGMSEIVDHWRNVQKVGEKVAEKFGHAETPREKELREQIEKLALETKAEKDLKNRIRDRWGALNDDMADFIDRKMEEFGLQFNAPDMFERFGWAKKGRRAIEMDKAPDPDSGLPYSGTSKTGALERGSAAAFSVLYGKPDAQEKALAVANKTLDKNEAMRRLLEKLERNMRDPVVLRRARL